MKNITAFSDIVNEFGRKPYFPIEIYFKNNENIIRYNLMDLIEEHNYFTKITADINKMFRLILFAFYYLGLTLILFSIYGSFHKKTAILAKIVTIPGAITGGIPYLIVTYFNKVVVEAAHKPYNLVFSYLCNTNSSKLPLVKRLKLLSFVERLSGPEIGFYCYDLFPMNSCEFYEMIMLSATNYLLLISLL